jgi:hypothetical protein
MWRLAWFSVAVAARLVPSGPAVAADGLAVRSAGPALHVDALIGEDGLVVGPTGPGGLTGSKPLPPLKTPIIQARPGRFIRVLGGAAWVSGDGAKHGRATSPDEEPARRTAARHGARAPGRCVLFCRFLL